MSTRLKITTIPDDKPTRLTVELPAAVYKDLSAYAEVLSRETGEQVKDVTRLIGPMIARFMASDRAFAKARKKS
ncbi:DUF2274 domain-containing protein [Bradyrhizobium sp. STM 3809]|uniref:DUF2274 domain-containing protein n=1 Tax=Bradyrhizobium sp. STM 3809 TaxID=551936 RepID=UPI0005512EA8|nr:DUF2274 domain-containing protein [Bradyrhizobium sp. STM 3809]